MTALLGSAPAELARAKGLGPARVARLLAALELGRRYLGAPVEPRCALAAPADAARFLKAKLLDLPHEVFCCLFLDTRHRLIRYEELFRGTIDGATVYPREVVKRALAAQCVGRDPRPQPPVGGVGAERGRPQHHAEACEGAGLVEIRLLDHVVVSRGGHVSLAERGLV